MKYKWENLETGNCGVSKFNGTHHWYFSDTEIGMHGAKLLLIEAQALIYKWNISQPESWSYKLL